MPQRPRDWFKARAAAGASRRNYDDLSIEFLTGLVNDPQFWSLPPEEQLSYLDELDKAKAELPNDGVLQSFWNAALGSFTKTLPEGAYAAPRLVEGLAERATGIDLPGPQDLIDTVGGAAYKLLGGNEYQPQTTGEKIVSYPVHAGAGILKTLPYLAMASQALPASPVAAAALGFGGAAATEGLANPELPTQDVAEDTALQALIGAAFGGIGKLGETAKWMTPAKETAMQAGVGLGGSLLNTQVLHPETPSDDAWIDALMQIGIPYAFHGMGFPTASGARMAREAREAAATDALSGALEELWPLRSKWESAQDSAKPTEQNLRATDETANAILNLLLEGSKPKGEIPSSTIPEVPPPTQPPTPPTQRPTPPRGVAPPPTVEPTVTVTEPVKPATPQERPGLTKPVVYDEDIVPEEARPFLDRWFSREEIAQMESLPPAEREILKDKIGGSEFQAHLDRLREKPPKPNQSAEDYFIERMIEDFESGNLPANSVNGLRLWATAARAAYDEGGGPALSAEAHAKQKPASYRNAATSILWRALTGFGENPGAVEALADVAGGPEKLLEYRGIAKRLAALRSDHYQMSRQEKTMMLQDQEMVKQLAAEQLQEILAGKRPNRERAGRPFGRESTEIPPDAKLSEQISQEITGGNVRLEVAGGPLGMSKQLEGAAKSVGVIPATLMPKAHALLTDAVVRGFWLLGGQNPREFWDTFGVAPGERFAPQTYDALVKKYGVEQGSKIFYSNAAINGPGKVLGMYMWDIDAPTGFAKRAIGIFSGADASVVRHELGHMFYDMLPPSGKAIYHAAVGLKNNEEPTVFDHETFAELFRHYLETGDAPSPQLEPIFKMFHDWNKQIAHPYLANEDLRQTLNPEIRDYITRVLRGQPGTVATEGRTADVGVGAKFAFKRAEPQESPTAPLAEGAETIQGIDTLGNIQPLELAGRKQTHLLRRNSELGEQGQYESYRTKDGRTWFRIKGAPVAFSEKEAGGKALHKHLRDLANKSPDGLTMQDLQSTVAKYVSLFTASHSRRERPGWNPQALLYSMHDLPKIMVEGKTVDISEFLGSGLAVDVKLDTRTGRWIAAAKEYPLGIMRAIGATAETASAAVTRFADTWLRGTKRVMAGRYGRDLLIADERLTNAFQSHYKPILDTINEIMAGKQKKPWLPGREGGLSTDEARALAEHLITNTAPEDPKLLTAYKRIRHSLLDPAIAAEARAEGESEWTMRARFLHKLLRELPGKDNKPIVREVVSVNDDVLADMDMIGAFLLTEPSRIKMTEAEYSDLTRALRSIGIDRNSISDAQVGKVFQTIAHDLAMHLANADEGYRFQKIIQIIKFRETDPRRLAELEEYKHMVLGGGLGGGMLYANIPGLPGLHRGTVMGALLGRSLLAQSLQGLAQLTKLPLRDVTGGFADMLSQLGKAFGGKAKFDPLGVTAGGIVSHAGPRTILDRVEAYHPFGQLEKMIRVWGEKSSTRYARRLGRAAAKQDLMAIREIQQTVGAQQLALETIVRWATDQPMREGMGSVGGLPYEVFQFVATTTREMALPYEAQARPSGWTRSETGKLLTGMKHFSLAQFYYVKDQIFGDLRNMVNAKAEGNEVLSRQYLNRALSRTAKLAVVGPAVGMLINTVWKAVSGQWDKSIANQIANMDDDTRSDAKQIMELYGRAMLDAGYIGILADLMNSAYKLVKGERNEYARDSLGFNISKLQDSVQYLNDLGTNVSRLLHGQPGAAKAIGRQTLKFGESMVPVLRLAEMPRTWGGRGLTDVIDPDVTQDRFRKAISAAHSSGNKRETRRLLAEYSKWLQNEITRTNNPRRRKMYRTALRRLTARKSRARLAPEE